MRRPRLLDAFCGAGGAGMGYHRAGFEVVGVDSDAKVGRHYPFEFYEGDALEFIDAHWHEFDAVHASPPCQDHMLTPGRHHGTGWLLGATRALLRDVGAVYVLECVPGAKMRADFKLCGCMFGLPQLRRERWFETSAHLFAMNLGHDHRQPAISVVGHGTPTWVRQKLGYNPTIAQYRAAMGIDWMNRDELSQAIPPAYTQHIGELLIDHLTSEVAA